MPMYGYRYTDAEGGNFETFQHIREDALTIHDGRPCERTVQLPKMHTNYGEGSRTEPIKMLSVAVDSVEEVHAFRQRNPGIDISDNPRDPDFGVPIAKSRREKLRILDREGFAETN